MLASKQLSGTRGHRGWPRPHHRPRTSTTPHSACGSRSASSARRLRPTDAAAAAGMTPARVSALLNLERHGPMRLAELAASEGVNPTMLSRIVADLVDSGLCERSCDPADRRSAWVQVTPRDASSPTACARSAPRRCTPRWGACATPTGGRSSGRCRRSKPWPSSSATGRRAPEETGRDAGCPHRARHLRGARGPQLPPLHQRPVDLARRDLDADDRAIVARARR